ncbi:hypothetical protein OG317_36730 [Streptomyces sp. NBC_01167]|uniref:hypothetical protein n=1 Tax=Streptomyces sp. NBC_01167 TaxID=2903756 RepID=UPI00386DB9E0|nr:hypothetical protein OG317_36730 [Streptomyces sp. NBC_01167]
MYEPNESDNEPQQGLPGPDQVITWLTEREAIERVLQTSLGSLPSDRDVMMAQMAEVLQATARGLSLEAAAVWAGVPEPILREWLEKDPAFTAAVYAAAALAATYGPRPRTTVGTPAKVRGVLVAMASGFNRADAVSLVGLGKVRALDEGVPAVRRLGGRRPPRAALQRESVYLPATYRPRRPGRKAPAQQTFRLVRRTASDAPRSGSDD